MNEFDETIKPLQFFMYITKREGTIFLERRETHTQIVDILYIHSDYNIVLTKFKSLILNIDEDLYPVIDQYPSLEKMRQLTEFPDILSVLYQAKEIEL